MDGEETSDVVSVAVSGVPRAPGALVRLRAPGGSTAVRARCDDPHTTRRSAHGSGWFLCRSSQDVQNVALTARS